ncbi:MAG: DNA mismatch repair protein MutS [Paludibacteraceae bacterium]|nr:DNA mismatch repair protein MutS [Paludibacteraceae bacterium]
MAKSTETPLMKQYFETKAQNPDAVLLFRVGDFYETYGADAVTAAKVLGITLTKRSSAVADSVELAGFPHHALDNYLPKLVRAGYRVAVCDQLEDPKLTKTLVKRGITELVTPGVSYNDQVLDGKSNNFLAALHVDKEGVGVAFLDVSTGEFMVAQGDSAYVDKLLGSIEPKEVLVERGREDWFRTTVKGRYFLYKLDDWIFTEDAARERLAKQFDSASLKGFGVEDLRLGVIAAGAALYYLDQTHHVQTSHIMRLSRIGSDEFVWMDKFTVRNLELFAPLSPEGRSLVDVIDRTLTPMGARLLKRWMAFPLKQVEAVAARQDAVDAYFKDPQVREVLTAKLPVVGDMERIVSKVAVGRANPRELVQLGQALSALSAIRKVSVASAQEAICRKGELLDPLEELAAQIQNWLEADPPIAVNRGRVIREGVNDELDEYRRIAFSGKDYIQQLQERESERTGIPSLKISYTNVFGYYIEVRNVHKEKVPAEWIRKQTLVNAERYITEELKQYEQKVLGAEDRILELETRLYGELLAHVAEYVGVLQRDARVAAEMDVLLGFQQLARESHYVRAVVDDSEVLEIKQGRHPVIETRMPAGEEYIANDVYLDTERQQIIIITGPNMAGKSALLRQTALIVLLAQMGCPVPAESAHIGLVDKIFTRVGASDNISMGESTFMVEMTEAASILNNLSQRSLVLFDELGRGTSTYDGISIAWSIVEYIHENARAHARTLFATHYHELNEMERSLPRVRNFNVSVREMDGRVIFLRKLVPGGSEHSFGIHVARLAGMPKSIVSRADQVLKELEDTHQEGPSSHKTVPQAKPVGEMTGHRAGMQLSLFQLDDPILSQIRDEILHADINNLTPIEALNKLSEIKKILTGRES